MNLNENIKTRVSQKSYIDKPVDLKLIQSLLDVSSYAPNHKMRQPWGVIVIEKEHYTHFKNHYLNRLSDEVKTKTEVKLNKMLKAPLLLSITMPLSDVYEEEIEDIQANAMFVQNFLLLANQEGLSTHVKTPDFIKTDLFKEAMGLPIDHIVTMIVMVGYKDESNKVKARTTSEHFTSYYR